MSEMSGGCLCAAVRYTINAEPVTVRACWCRDCQYIASNGTVNMIVPTAALVITGNVSGYESTVHSGNKLLRRFCPTCGAQLFANSSARPQFTGVRVGTLDNPSAVRPAVNIWVSSAPTWACLDTALERVEQQPGALPAASSAAR